MFDFLFPFQLGLRDTARRGFTLDSNESSVYARDEVGVPWLGISPSSHRRPESTDFLDVILNLFLNLRLKSSLFHGTVAGGIAPRVGTLLIPNYISFIPCRFGRFRLRRGFGPYRDRGIIDTGIVDITLVDGPYLGESTVYRRVELCPGGVVEDLTSNHHLDVEHIPLLNPPLVGNPDAVGLPYRPDRETADEYHLQHLTGSSTVPGSGIRGMR